VGAAFFAINNNIVPRSFFTDTKRSGVKLHTARPGSATLLCTFVVGQNLKKRGDITETTIGEELAC